MKFKNKLIEIIKWNIDCQIYGIVFLITTWRSLSLQTETATISTGLWNIYKC